MGIKDYLKNIAPTPPAYRTMREDSRRKGTNELSMREIDREVAAVRRQRLKLDPARCESSMALIRKISKLVKPRRTLTVSPDESDNRF